MARPGITLPTVDYLANLPLTASAGSCLTADPRGTGRYIYSLVPTAAGGCTVWRIDTIAKSIQILPTPTTGANTVIGAGTCLLFDASRGTNGAGFLWLLCAESATAAGTEWARFQYLDLGNPGAGWTARTVVGLGLAAQMPEVALAHTCTSLVAGVNDDYIYASAVGSSRLWRFDIAGNAWSVALANTRGGAAATGTTAMFSAAQPDRIYTLRGGGSAVMDYYSIVGDAWATLALVPATETWTAGTESFYLGAGATAGEALLAQGGKVKVVDLTTGAIVPFCEIDGADGAAHLGNGLVAYAAGPAMYVAIRPHSSRDVQRIRIVY